MSDDGHEPLRHEVQRWRGLVDHLPALVAFWDRDLRNVVANAAYVRWFGLTPQEVRGMHIEDVLGPELYRANLPYIRGALAGERQHFDRSLVTTAGETRYTQAEYIPEVTADGVGGFYVLVADTTEKVQAQHDLLAAQALARVGSYTIEPGSGTLRLSPEVVRLLGFEDPPPDVTLEQYLSAVHPEDRDTVQAAWARARRGGEYELNYRLVGADGEVRHVHSRTSQIRSSTGDVLMLRGVMQDVTQIQQFALQLEAKNQLLTDLIALLGHDLGQPIGAVNGYLELLGTEVGLDDVERHHLLDRATGAGRRVERLLGDILTIVNVDSSQLPTRPAAVNVMSSVNDTARHLGLELGRRCETGALAWVDPIHLDRIVDNLLTNAERYGDPPYMVDLHLDRSDVVISLRDHGPGVPTDFVPHLFERFSRATTGVAASAPGTGLGLHLIRQLATANNGTVDHRAPADGPGAIFELRLPAAPGH